MIPRDKCSIEEMNGGMVVIKIQTVIPIEILTQEIPDIIEYIADNLKNVIQKGLEETKKENDE